MFEEEWDDEEEYDYEDDYEDDYDDEELWEIASLRKLIKDIAKGIVEAIEDCELEPETDINELWDIKEEIGRAVVQELMEYTDTVGELISDLKSIYRG